MWCDTGWLNRSDERYSAVWFAVGVWLRGVALMLGAFGEPAIGL